MPSEGFTCTEFLPRKGLAYMCSWESHVLKAGRGFPCPKLVSGLPFSVNSCILNCSISSRGSIQEVDSALSLHVMSVFVCP